MQKTNMGLSPSCWVRGGMAQHLGGDLSVGNSALLAFCFLIIQWTGLNLLPACPSSGFGVQM